MKDIDFEAEVWDENTDEESMFSEKLADDTLICNSVPKRVPLLGFIRSLTRLEIL